MAIFLNYKSLILYCIPIVLLLTSGTINLQIQKPHIEVSKQQSALNFNTELIKLFSSGQKRMISGLFWITTLLESDLEHYNKKNLNSWMYLRFKTILAIDPKFLKAYQFGGKYLSIVKDDLVGAEQIFLAGIKEFPSDFELRFNIAFLYGFELEDYAKAAIAYKELLSYPQSPPYIKSLAVKFTHAKTNDLSQSFKVLLDIFTNEPDGTFLKVKLKMDLYAIKAQIDLDCLNKSNGNCDMLDFEGQPYISNGKNFKAQKKFTPYKLRRKNQ